MLSLLAILASVFPDNNDYCGLASNCMKYRQHITSALSHCLLGCAGAQQGKVRDHYLYQDKIILVSTDRQSAFDRLLTAVPFKGQVLNQCSAWWCQQTQHIINNHLLAVPDPNVTIAKRCRVFPIEVVVRGYITGSTNTALWTQYQQGVRRYCGHVLPEGLQKNQQLSQAIVTPTTKDNAHDRPVSGKDIIAHGWMTAQQWHYVHDKALELFAYGQQQAVERGLMLVDTKYEFGQDQQGNIIVVDEMHTPDSSRYWLAESYQQRFSQQQEPENIDKEFLRLWFARHCHPYHDQQLPEAPQELIIELSSRYIQLYEMITGQAFVFPALTQCVQQRVMAVINSMMTSHH